MDIEREVTTSVKGKKNQRGRGGPQRERPYEMEEKNTKLLGRGPRTKTLWVALKKGFVIHARPTFV